MNELNQYYQILGLKTGASEEEITQAYMILIKTWYPQQNHENQSIQKIANEKLKEIEEAYVKLMLFIEGHYEHRQKPQEAHLREKTELSGGKIDVMGKEVVGHPELLTGGLLVQTEPLESVIYLDDQAVGLTPYESKDLPIGSYKLRIIKEGYEIWEKAINIEAKKQLKITVRLRLQESKYPLIWKEPLIDMEFIFVKGGSFQMGDIFGEGGESEKPVHEVCLSEFYMSKYVVTQQQWIKIMNNNPSRNKKGGDYPVEKVTWKDAQDLSEG